MAHHFSVGANSGTRCYDLKLCLVDSVLCVVKKKAREGLAVKTDSRGRRPQTARYHNAQ